MYSYQSSTSYLLNSMTKENFVINAVVDKSEATKDQYDHTDITRSLLLSLRLGTLAIMVALLTLHLRSVRVFRWEQSVSGGLLITYLIAVIGLALCAGNPVSLKKGVVLQTYLCGTGAALLALNAACLWRRWRHAGDLTRAVADLLSALGVPLRQQMLIKVVLSSIAASAFLTDMAMNILILRAEPTSHVISGIPSVKRSGLS